MQQSRRTITTVAIALALSTVVLSGELAAGVAVRQRIDQPAVTDHRRGGAAAFALGVRGNPTTSGVGARGENWSARCRPVSSLSLLPSTPDGGQSLTDHGAPAEGSLTPVATISLLGPPGLRRNASRLAVPEVS